MFLLKIVTISTLALVCTCLIPNLCVNCKFSKIDTFSSKEFSKCSMFPQLSYFEDKTYLVTGVKKNQKIEYSYCSLVRRNENQCGEEGKFYKEKEKRFIYF